MSPKTARSAAVWMSAAAAGLALADDVNPIFPDLTFSLAEINRVVPTEDGFDIDFTVQVVNIGDFEIDLTGLDPNEASDNAGLQTYLTANADGSGPAFAASGWTFTNDRVLQPGESIVATFTANTRQLPDPFNLNLDYLVIDIRELYYEPQSNKGNNRVILALPEPVTPTPGTAALVGASGLLAARRRRA
ncbi:MAG: hypothetical protein AAGJ54_07120 [Planctomycetota bacterium]